VSGKALRLYEEQGLIRAERTPAGWRVYGPEQIARLHRVLALKGFGFPLARIAELLSGRIIDLATFLEIHEQVLIQDAKRINKALQLISAARTRLSELGELSSDDLMDLTRETTMTTNAADLTAAYEATAAKHLSPADRETLAAHGYKGMTEPDPGWAALHQEAAQLMIADDPRSPEAMDLARRWMTKVFEATGGDPALTRKVRDVARDLHDQPAFAAASTSSNEMIDFISEAYGAAIAAGTMPKPA
jgi:MerR family transcriptional regulator, thiopeptide resistance regulator